MSDCLNASLTRTLVEPFSAMVGKSFLELLKYWNAMRSREF